MQRNCLKETTCLLDDDDDDKWFSKLSLFLVTMRIKNKINRENKDFYFLN